MNQCRKGGAQRDVFWLILSRAGPMPASPSDINTQVFYKLRKGTNRLLMKTIPKMLTSSSPGGVMSLQQLVETSSSKLQ